MRLEDKLRSIPSNQRLEEIYQMVDSNKLEVCFSRWGERCVKYQGYEGRTSIGQLARYFFTSSPFTEPKPSLQKRWDGYQLWEKMEQLYVQSDEKLKKCSLLFRVFVYLREFFAKLFVYFGMDFNRRAKLEEPDFTWRNACLFLFTYEEYQKHWPEEVEKDENIQPASMAYLVATKEMIQRALEQEQKNLEHIC